MQSFTFKVPQVNSDQMDEILRVQYPTTYVGLVYVESEGTLVIHMDREGDEKAMGHALDAIVKSYQYVPEPIEDTLTLEDRLELMESRLDEINDRLSAFLLTGN